MSGCSTEIAAGWEPQGLQCLAHPNDLAALHRVFDAITTVHMKKRVCAFFFFDESAHHCYSSPVKVRDEGFTHVTIDHERRRTLSLVFFARLALLAPWRWPSGESGEFFYEEESTIHLYISKQSTGARIAVPDFGAAYF